MSQIFGIVNITRDSFSDGGRYLAPEDAVAKAKELLEEGAAVVDLGAASTHPASETVSAATEIERLGPVIRSLRLTSKAAISVDTFHPEVQRFAIECGAQYINDVRGFASAETYPDLAAASCELVVMHAVGGRGRAAAESTRPADIMELIFRFFEKRIDALVKAGVAEDRLILDPGMGFFLGRDPEVSYTVLRSLTELKAKFALPVLISVSRKSFLRASIGGNLEHARDARIQSATLASELYAASQGVDFIRTHDVRGLSTGLVVQNRLRSRA